MMIRDDDIVRNVFIIGSKGIPARYGGFETFVEKLTYYKKSNQIKYHVACIANDEKEFEYNGARCFNVTVPNIGSAKAIIYDVKALKMCEEHIRRNKIKNAIIYILACRIGPFLAFYKKKFAKQGIKIIVNPDGHEWKRSKWNRVIKAYWKYSERLMVKHADLLICDSREIEKYIKNEYGKYNLSTIFIAYGADIGASTLTDDDEKYLHWLEKYHIKPNNYYLVVGRFVPENNYETIIREFMSTDIPKDLVIITNMEENKFYNKLKLKNQFTKDDRIKFVGTVYDQELLKKIREKAYAYIHGHEVGGTNPSLLEALASTKINILFDISFNREVGGDSALYFSKNIGNLSEVINKVERLNNHDADNLSQKAKKIITNKYSWDKIINDYENLLISDFSSFNFNDIIDAKN